MALGLGRRGLLFRFSWGILFKLWAYARLTETTGGHTKKFRFFEKSGRGHSRATANEGISFFFLPFGRFGCTELHYRRVHTQVFFVCYYIFSWVQRSSLLQFCVFDKKKKTDRRESRLFLASEKAADINRYNTLATPTTLSLTHFSASFYYLLQRDLSIILLFPPHVFSLSKKAW